MQHARRDLLSIFELLEPLGLATAAVVSAAVLQPERVAVLGLGEHHYRPLGGDSHQIPGDRITDQALEWLSRHGHRPFALWLHYFDTHEPYRPPPDFAERFRRPYGGALSQSLSTRWLSSLKDPEAAAKLSAADRRHIVDLYDAEIAFLDHQLGRLFAYLESSGRWRDTAVVVVGDHGQAHGESGRYGHGDWLLEPVVKVPLLIRLPGQQRGRRVETPVETRDLVPTLAELFGTAPCPECRGRSLAAALRGESIPPPAYRVVERRVFAGPDERRGLSIYRRDWKLTFYQEGEESFYHLGKTSGRGGLDGESFYSPEGPEAARFEGLIEALRRRQVEPQVLSDETREMLRSLGYLQ